MKKEIIISVSANTIYFIDNNVDYLLSDEIEPNYIMVYDKAEVLLNTIKNYQNQGYTITFK
jgi:hypothetical protein